MFILSQDKTRIFNMSGHIIKTDGSHDEKRMDDCPIIQRKKKRKAKRR